jgi:hypothetical protein
MRGRPPTPKGVTLRRELLPQVVEALQAAEQAIKEDIGHE